MEYKVSPIFATKLDEEKGIVEVIFSIFGNVDKGKDIVHPGAFTKTFAEQGLKVKILDLHKTDSILRVLGRPLALREISRSELPSDVLEKHPEATGGAWAEIQFNMQTRNGHDAFQLFKAGDVSDMSYGYDALDVDYSGAGMAKVRNLRTIKLFELSPVIWGMNPATMAVAAKMEAKPVEETENTIRIQVRDSDDFQEGTLRTITISEEQGITALMGRLSGETTLTLGTYIFDREKWTVGEAQEWVSEHTKAEHILSVVLETMELDSVSSEVAGPDTDTTHLLDKEVGPGDVPPTGEDLLRIIKIEQLEIDLEGV